MNHKPPHIRAWFLADTQDCFTLLPPASAVGHKDRNGWHGLGTCRDPEGHSYRVEGIKPGSHLGVRTPWHRLPPAVQRLAEREWPEFIDIPVLTEEQEQALERFRHRYKDWKDELRVAWYTGKDTSLQDGALLRQVRNTFGPLWLDDYEKATLR
jgi:hypothetical protein